MSLPQYLKKVVLFIQHIVQQHLSKWYVDHPQNYNTRKSAYICAEKCVIPKILSFCFARVSLHKGPKPIWDMKNLEKNIREENFWLTFGIACRIPNRHLELRLVWQHIQTPKNRENALLENGLKTSDQMCLICHLHVSNLFRLFVKLDFTDYDWIVSEIADATLFEKGEPNE